MKLTLEIEECTVLSGFSTDTLKLRVRDKNGGDVFFIVPGMPRDAGTKLAVELGLGAIVKQQYVHPR